MTQQDVYTLCRKYAPLYDFDPILILALIEQESNYETHARRLEQGFYLRYTRNRADLNDVDEVLLAASWGLGQLMGESLYELGYFGGFATIYDGLIAYLDNPAKQVETIVEWLGKKRLKAGGDQTKMLSLWNGDTTGMYAKQVLARYERMKKEL